jgi:hypothetical protein
VVESFGDSGRSPYHRLIRSPQLTSHEVIKALWWCVGNDRPGRPLFQISVLDVRFVGFQTGAVI